MQDDPAFAPESGTVREAAYPFQGERSGATSSEEEDMSQYGELPCGLASAAKEGHPRISPSSYSFCSCPRSRREAPQGRLMQRQGRQQAC